MADLIAAIENQDRKYNLALVIPYFWSAIYLKNFGGGSSVFGIANL